MDITIGKCGIACGLCKNFEKGCLGCEKENSKRKRCIIFKCAEEKNVSNCLRCAEFPCGLMKGLSRSYCPIIPLIKLDL